MKASIVEIHKKYCIILTADGQFVRQDVPAGAYEIGDEIIIDAADFLDVKEKPLKKPFSIFAKLAAGLAVIIILGGVSYLGIKYAGLGLAFSPVRVASEAVQAKTIDTASGQESAKGSQGDKGQDQQALSAEAPNTEPGIAGAQSSESSANKVQAEQPSSASDQSGQSDKTQSSQDDSTTAPGTNNEGELDEVPLPVLFEGTFKLDKKNIDILTNYPDLYITYIFEEKYTQDSVTGETKTFTLKIKNLQKSTFNGNIDIIFIDKSSKTLQTSAIEIENLAFNDEIIEEIQIAENTDSFKMILYGNFAEP